jgi:hypothetical protein
MDGKKIFVEDVNLYYLNIDSPTSILTKKESLVPGDLLVTEKEYSNLYKMETFNKINIFEYSKTQ